MENLLNSKKSADVTLICDDTTKFQAHKFVLSACSPVFQSIIDDLPKKEVSFIYLRGVEPQEMKSILQFMYLGQATFYHDRMNEFLNVAKSLEIKEISKDVEHEDEEASKNDLTDDDVLQDNENSNIWETNEQLSNMVAEVNNTETKITQSLMKESVKCQCSKCDKQFAH